MPNTVKKVVKIVIIQTMRFTTLPEMEISDHSLTGKLFGFAGPRDLPLDLSYVPDLCD